jgi:hypothetical protein
MAGNACSCPFLPPPCHDGGECDGTPHPAAPQRGLYELLRIAHETAQGRAAIDVSVIVRLRVRIPLGSLQAAVIIGSFRGSVLFATWLPSRRSVFGQIGTWPVRTPRWGASCARRRACDAVSRSIHLPSGAQEIPYCGPPMVRPASMAPAACRRPARSCRRSPAISRVGSPRRLVCACGGG